GVRFRSPLMNFAGLLIDGAEDSYEVLGGRTFDEQAGKIHQWQRQQVGKKERPTQRRGPFGHVGVETDLSDEPSRAPDNKERRLQVIRRIKEEPQLLENAELP